MAYRVNKGKPTKLEKLHWWLLHHGPRRHITIETRNGLVTFDSKDKAVGKHIFFRREYDIDEVSQTVQLLIDNGYVDSQKPGTALNVGANIGLIALALKRHSIFERVLAFEPVPSNFAILVENIGQNGYSDEIECLEMALSDTDGEITMELSGENFGDHRVRSSEEKGHFHEERRETITVKTRRLDSLIAIGKFEEEPPGLVWMDIQGHDGDFYLGAKEIIRRYQVPVVSEFWPYGIRRAGFSSTQYCEIVSSLFSHYSDPKGASEFCSMDSFSSMFEKYTGPEDGSDIVLINESWRH